MFVLPRRIAPAPASSKATLLSCFGMNFASIFDPAVVRIPRVQKLSFSEIGIPKSGLLSFTEFARLVRTNSLSASRACFRARSASTVRNALIDGFSLSMRDKDAFTRSTGEISLRRSKRAACWIERKANSHSRLEVIRPTKKSSPPAAAFRQKRHLRCEKPQDIGSRCESNRMKIGGTQNQIHNRSRCNSLQESGFEMLAA